MQQYQIHYAVVDHPNITKSFTVPEGYKLQSGMRKFFSENWDLEPTHVTDLLTGERVDKSLWGFDNGEREHNFIEQDFTEIPHEAWAALALLEQ